MALSIDVLRNRDFRLLMFMRMGVMMALQAQDVIIGWQVYSLTHDPFMLGLTGLAEAVPALTCALIAGHIVDISRPWRIYLFCIGGLMLNTLLLLLIGGGIVPMALGIVPWLFGGIFISGLARSFIMPASFAMLSQVAPRHQISAASAWLSSGFQLAAICGPAVAGLVYGGYGARIAWLLPVALMAIAFILLLGFSKGPRCYRSNHRREAAVKSIRAGWRFIWSSKVLLSVMALDMFAVLFGGAVAMLPAYADQVLHVGSEGLGILRSAPALGAIITALTLALRPLKKVKATTLLIVVTGFGGSIIGFGFSHIFWLSMFFLAVSGMFDSVSMIIRSTLMQLLTPEEMRGRVSAVNSMFIISSNEIGAFESGLAAKLFGLVPSIVFGGVCTLVVVAATATISPRFRRTVVEAHKESEA